MTDNQKHLRFSVLARIEHWVLTISFTILAITGLVQKYSSYGLSRSIIKSMGGIESVRLVHRGAAIVLMLVVVYHIGVVGYKLFVRRSRMTMLPGLHDVRAALQSLNFNLGLSKDRPKQGRYTFEEKAEYWAMVWGTLIMVITGFVLWNPIATNRILPGQFIPAAKIAHGAEAVLASVAIIVWHLYGVHVKIFNKSIFTGRLSEEEMEHEHAVELAEIKAGVADRPVSKEVLRKRRRPFFIVYGLLALLLVLTIYWFVTFEETAIATVPPAEVVEVFVPLTATPLPTPPPTPTPKPTSTPKPTAEPDAAPAEPEPGITWQDGVADLFQEKCAACHSDANALGGLNLGSYEATLAGGNSGPAIEAGDPDASGLVTLQMQGGHPGQFTEDELELIRQWIADGALADAASEAKEPAAEVEISWESDMADLMQEKCVACHSEANALGGLDLSSYEATLLGGNTGPAIQPGDSGGSNLLTVQAGGGHPGQLSEDELALILQWVEAGAPAK